MPTRLSHLTRRLYVYGLPVIVLTIAAILTYTAISVTDDSGAIVTLQRPAQRIVSLTPHVTESLFAAGGGARIVDAVVYSGYPPSARGILHIGDNRPLDLERIAAFKPDLVVVWRHGSAQKQIGRLHAFNIPLFSSEPYHISDIPRSIKTLDTLLDTRVSVHDAAQQFRQRADTPRQRYANWPAASVFYQVWEQPPMTPNGRYISSDMLALCDGRNVFAREPLLAPAVSSKATITANPEVLLTASMSTIQGSRPIDTPDARKRWPQLFAMQRGDLFSINGDLISRFGPHLVGAATLLCEDLEQAHIRRLGSQATNGPGR